MTDTKIKVISEMPRAAHQSWAFFFEKIVKEPNWFKLKKFVAANKHHICPDIENIFKAFSLPVDNIKVIFLGLSPYQNIYRGQKFATGLAFGVPDKSMDTPSLKVIRDELENTYPDKYIDSPQVFDYTLQHWHDQGVFLINSAFTVRRRGNAKSHLPMWDWFTTELMLFLNSKVSSGIFVFMGKDAQTFNPLINEQYHYKFDTYHPAAEARGNNKYKFTGTGIFKNINEILENLYGKEHIINWLKS